MNGVRGALLAVGLAAGVFGVVQLLDESILSVALWFAGCVLVTDLVVNPLLVAGGVGGRRVLPASLVVPVLAGVAATLTLAAVSVPVLFRRGAIPDNPSLLDRNFPLGLAVAVGVVWAAVAISVLVRRLVVNGRGTDRSDGAARARSEAA